MNAAKIVKRLKELGSPKKAAVLSGFFKCGTGQYGEGDRFLGVTVPEQRTIAKACAPLSFQEIEKLLESPYHEVRLTGLLVLTYAFEKAVRKGRKEIFDFYCAHLSAANNWDLVDVTAPKIIGEHLFEKRSERKILYRFAKSENLWERRIAIVSTLSFIRQGDFSDTLSIALMLLRDSHDLIHKAVGWMLREVGKRDESVLKEFLEINARLMPRTMLRYAIERLDKKEQSRFMKA